MAITKLRANEVRKAPTAQGSDEQYVNLAMQSMTVSRDTFLPWFKGAGRRYRLYRGYMSGKYVPYRSNVTIPVAFSMIQSDVAKKANLSLIDPIVQFQASGPEDQSIARKRTALVNTQLNDADLYDKGVNGLLGADIWGVQVFEYHWDTKKAETNFRADLGQGEQAFSNEEVVFDGPNLFPIDPRNFFPQPGRSRIKDMDWAVRRFFLEKEDINQLAEAGYFLKKGAEKLAGTGASVYEDSMNTEFGLKDPSSTTFDMQFKTTDFQHPVECFRFVGRCPRAMSVDGSTNIEIIVANRGVLLRAAKNPHGRINMIEFSSMPDPLYFHAPSKIEVVEKLQIATNALASQKIDALNLFVNPQFLYNSKALPNPKKLVSRPGAWHRFEGEVGSNNVTPLFPNLQGLANTYTEVEQHAQWMEQGTGVVRDTVQGMAGPDRETARGFLGRQEGANTRLLMEARLFEKRFIEPVAARFVELNRKFLSFPRQVKMIGANAVIDPVTFQPIPNNMVMMGVNDLLPDYDAIGVGSTRFINKQQQQQSLMMLMQVMQTNPVAIQAVNWMVWFRNLFEVFEIPNVDELLNTQEPIMQVMQQLMAQQGNEAMKNSPMTGGTSSSANLTNAGSGALQ